MAVVQISLIQLRHGNKLSGSGVPQLSTAEMAWTVDTQELFIGNGSLAEGAPYVGNTKILTEHDDLLSLVSSYRYDSNNPSTMLSVERGLQTKLDETVSVLDFGAVGDGITDSADAFENAFKTVSENINPLKRKVIFVPSGVYKFYRSIKIPSNTHLIGESSNTAVLDIGEYNIYTIDRVSDSITDPRDNALATNIEISRLTISHSTGKTILNKTRNFRASQVVWSGNWDLVDPALEAVNSRLVFPVPVLQPGGRVTVTGTGVTDEMFVDFTASHTNTLTQLVGSLNNDVLFSTKYVASVIGLALVITSKNQATLPEQINLDFTVVSLTSNQPGVIAAQVIPTFEQATDGAENVSPSVKWVNDDYGTSTTNIEFNECEFVNTVVGIQCFQHSVHSTSVSVRNSNFDTCYNGVYIKGVVDQENNWVIDECAFDGIGGPAVDIVHGSGAVVRNCRFVNVGNGNNLPQYPSTPIVQFGQPKNNLVIGCTSNRMQHQVSLDSSKIAVPDVKNASSSHLVSDVVANVQLTDSFLTLTVLPMNKFVELEYKLVLNGSARWGTITIVTAESASSVQFSDNYNYNNESITNFQFRVNAVDNNQDGVLDTVILQYKNPLLTGALGQFVYSVKQSF